MTAPRRLLDRRRFLLAGITATVAACAGQADPLSEPAAPADDAPSASTTPPSPAATTAPAPPDAGTDAATADDGLTPEERAAQSPDRTAFPTGIVPTRIEIDSIGVAAPVVLLNLTADEAEVPEGWDDAGWWQQTRKPGEIGPAVMGGHVDSKAGPAVFFRLRDLRIGDEVTVYDDSGDARTFVVNTDPIQVSKYDRPEEVFGFGQARPELRLITCGGDFNPAIGHYVDNIVVFCHDPAFQA